MIELQRRPRIVTGFESPAPGAPGLPATWTGGRKQAVGTSLQSSRVWFTIGGGIVTEIFYPHVDTPQIRDLGFIVADGEGFWHEVKRSDSAVVESVAAGIPAYRITHRHARFVLSLRIVADPHRDVIVVETQLDAADTMRLYALLAPHLRERADTVASIRRHGAWHALCAQSGGEIASALLAADERGEDAWQAASCGYVGTSDGWQDFAQHGRLEWAYSSAGPGNVALIGELAARGRVRLALGFERSAEGASTLAGASLATSFDELWQRNIDDWSAWHQGMRPQRAATARDVPSSVESALATSAMVLKTHHDKDFLGAAVASLSTPWGQSRGDVGGYHLVWPRDVVEMAGGMLALGDLDGARNLLRYLIATQQPDGHWSQNQWLSGEPYWNGIQLDEVGLPILLASALAERNALDGIPAAPMVRRAASFIVRHGPVTPQDRWERDSGLNPFTLAICICALVSSAQFLDEPARSYVLELADDWNAHIEAWTYAATPIADRAGIAGHYLRNTPPEAFDPAFDLAAWARNGASPSRLLGLEFLALTRFGLRDPADVRIVDSVRAVDDALRVQTPNGDLWRRFPEDRYGEHADGSPYDGDGIGRGWPLLVGERGHYAVAMRQDAMPYLLTMIRVAPDGMIPEQVWDGEPIRSRRLAPGEPSGSACPLVWAHAEFIKLYTSAALGRPFDRPQAVEERYHGITPKATMERWRFDCRPSMVPRGRRLRLELDAAARVRYSVDDWHTVHEVATSESGFGLHLADLATNTAVANRVSFTFRWTETGTWEGQDFTVLIG